MTCANVSYVTRNEISTGSDKRQIISLWTRLKKIAHFGNVMSHDVAKVNRFYNGGLWDSLSFFFEPN